MKRLSIFYHFYLRRSLFLSFAVSLVACAKTYENTAIQSWKQMARGQYDKALQNYEKGVTGKNEALLRLMDEGLILRAAARYKESNEKLFQASRIIERAGYISVSEQVVTSLTNERHQFYQGEDFEKVLIHVFLALNFIELEEWESALVEARRVNEILVKLISDAKRPYKQNAFARYLMALSYESQREYNDAFIAYRNVVEHKPDLVESFPEIQKDILRMAARMGFDQELRDFKKKFGKTAWVQAKETLEASHGSLVLLFSNGKSPMKYSSNETHKTTGRNRTPVDVVVPVPVYRRRAFQIHAAQIRLQDGSLSSTTSVLESIEETAKRHLKDRMGRIMAKAIAAAATKAGIATGVGLATDSEDLGLLTGLLLFSMSQADTRSWLLLPAELQVAKLHLPAGSYKVEIDYLNRAGEVLETEGPLLVDVKAKALTFLQRRAFD